MKIKISYGYTMYNADTHVSEGDKISEFPRIK